MNRPSHTKSRLTYILGTCLLLIVAAGQAASAQTESVIYNFGLPRYGDASPQSNLFRDAAGNLFGLAPGQSNCEISCGELFELSPNLDGSWTETVPFVFPGGAGGAAVSGSLVADAAGNFYGTTVGGGNVSLCKNYFGCGTVFELSRGANGVWTESILYTFNGTPDGSYPEKIVMDGSGNIFGTTASGGIHGFGTLYELARNSSGTYSHRNLYQFSGGKDGSLPYGVALDAPGDIFVTAQLGGIQNRSCPREGCGALLEFSPNGSGDYNPRLIYEFQGKHDGSIPGGLTVDGAGNLFGVAGAGGLDSLCHPLSGYYWGCGVIFEFVPNGGNLLGKIIYTFADADDGQGNAYNSPILDRMGNIYVASYPAHDNSSGDSVNGGALIKLTPTQQGYAADVLHTFPLFTADDGAVPNDPLVDSSNGTIYGSTNAGGESTAGVAYQITTPR